MIPLVITVIFLTLATVLQAIFKLMINGCQDQYAPVVVYIP